MRIGILETGQLTEDLTAVHGTYPDMFKRMLGELRPSLEFEVFSAVEGDVPSDPHLVDAWLVTGSRHGVYDKLPWMEPLKELIRAATDRYVPVLAICFGHQIVAEALGGRAVKSDKGWGVGVNTYQVYERPDWMADAPDEIAINAMHQDQVVELPANAKVIAGSQFCPNAIVTYGDTVWSIQPHPEFNPEFEAALIKARRERFDDAQFAAALESLAKPIDSRQVGEWMLAFVDQALRRRSAMSRAAE